MDDKIRAAVQLMIAARSDVRKQASDERREAFREVSNWYREKIDGISRLSKEETSRIIVDVLKRNPEARRALVAR